MLGRTIALLILGAALLTGCGAPPAADRPSAAPQEIGPPRSEVLATAPAVDAAARDASEVDRASPPPAEPEAIASDGGPSDAPAAPPAPATLDPDRDFQPTDPAGVELAAGRPKLIEFFAFW